MSTFHANHDGLTISTSKTLINITQTSSFFIQLMHCPLSDLHLNMPF